MSKVFLSIERVDGLGQSLLSPREAASFMSPTCWEPHPGADPWWVGHCGGRKL